MNDIKYTPESLEQLNESLNDGLNSGRIRSEVRRDSYGKVVGVDFVSNKDPAAKWPAPIPVGVRLPNGHCVVLAFEHDEWSSADFDGRHFIVDGVQLQAVSHWLPLPPKPEETPTKTLYGKQVVLKDLPEAKGQWTMAPLPKPE